MRNQKGFIGILLLVIASVLVAGGGYYVYEQQKINKADVSLEQEQNTTVDAQQKSVSEEVPVASIVTTKKDVSSTAEIEGVGNISIKTDITTSVDCGSEDCFQKKFSSCEPATLTADSGFASVYYKIIGLKNSSCEVSFKYTQNPNPAWVNKEMICMVDNKVSFEKSFQDQFEKAISGTSSCTGPLIQVLQSM